LEYEGRRYRVEGADMSAHTPAPWTVGEYSETLGYDCMYGGVRVGPVVLDGRDYGQNACADIAAAAKAQMMADAALISAAPFLLAACEIALLALIESGIVDGRQALRAAVTKATGAA
jgi:hypothetical protein